MNDKPLSPQEMEQLQALQARYQKHHAGAMTAYVAALREAQYSHNPLLSMIGAARAALAQTTAKDATDNIMTLLRDYLRLNPVAADRPNLGGDLEVQTVWDAISVVTRLDGPALRYVHFALRHIAAPLGLTSSRGLHRDYRVAQKALQTVGALRRSEANGLRERAASAEVGGDDADPAPTTDDAHPVLSPAQLELMRRILDGEQRRLPPLVSTSPYRSARLGDDVPRGLQDGFTAENLSADHQPEEPSAEEPPAGEPDVAPQPRPRRPNLRPLSAEALAARAPLPMESMCDALWDRVHRDPPDAQTRPAVTVRSNAAAMARIEAVREGRMPPDEAAQLIKADAAWWRERAKGGV